MRKNMIQNWPITATDVTNYHTIIGLNISGNKWETVKHKLYRVDMDYVAVPTDIIKLNKFAIPV